MCIIIIKNKNQAIPESIMSTCWSNNPDGAGYMYADGTAVHIKKGFMSYDGLMDSINALPAAVRDGVMVVHFRIATHGGVNAENTHPFPITDDVKQLHGKKITAPLAIAHNGVISIAPRKKTISDTGEYILSRLAPLYKTSPRFYQSDAYLNLIADSINGSRLAIMDKRGNVYRVGSWTYDKATGLYFSNATYKTPKWADTYDGFYDTKKWAKAKSSFLLDDDMRQTWEMLCPIPDGVPVYIRTTNAGLVPLAVRNATMYIDAENNVYTDAGKESVRRSTVYVVKAEDVSFEWTNAVWRVIL